MEGLRLGLRLGFPSEIGLGFGFCSERMEEVEGIGFCFCLERMEEGEGEVDLEKNEVIWRC